MKKEVRRIFYLLIRDHLPAGKLIDVVKYQKAPSGIDTIYSNKYILDLADYFIANMESKETIA